MVPGATSKLRACLWEGGQLWSLPSRGERQQFEEARSTVGMPLVGFRLGQHRHKGPWSAAWSSFPAGLWKSRAPGTQLSQMPQGLCPEMPACPQVRPGPRGWAEPCWQRKVRPMTSRKQSSVTADHPAAQGGAAGDLSAREAGRRRVKHRQAGWRRAEGRQWAVCGSVAARAPQVPGPPGKLSMCSLLEERGPLWFQRTPKSKGPELGGGRVGGSGGDGGGSTCP